MDDVKGFVEKMLTHAKECSSADMVINCRAQTFGVIMFAQKFLPYDEIERDKKTVDFKTYNLELLLKLKKRYQPENYTPGDKNSEKNYCIKHEIASKLGNLISKLNK
jgi:hypothetical protein